MAWYRVTPTCSKASRLTRHYPSILASGLSLLATSLVGCGAREPGVTEVGTVAVGVVVPITGGGLMLEARQAWELVVEQINEGGGIDRKMLSVHERDLPLDDASDLSPVADGFVNLANEGYKYIISLVSGEALQPMMDAAMPHGVLAMSITSEDAVADLPEFDGMLLRAILPTDRLIQKQALALRAEGLASIAIVGETLAGAPDARQLAMQGAYADCEGCSAVSVTYPAEADLYRYDWESVGAAVIASAPDVVYLASADVSALLDTIFWTERAGYTGRYYFAHGGFMASVSAAMPGSKVPQRFRSYDLALPPSERLDRFLSTYEARYGDSFVPEPRLIAFADYLSLLALAMTRVGDGDPRAVSAAMKDLATPPGEVFGTLEFMQAAAAVRAGRDIDFVGLSGPLDLDARGEVADGYVREYGVTPSGDVVPLP
jgi:branched-chain amino acid transport system substrate-binding protein